MESIWKKSCDIAKREKLCKEIETDTVIIGGGITGIQTAYLLNQKGVENIVIEASSIGSGQTKNTTAKITSQHGLIYDKLIDNFGKKKALEYAAANNSAIDKFARIIKNNKIECDFEYTDAYLYSQTDAETLELEARAAADLSLPASFVTDIDLPFPVCGAVRFENQAQFNPMKYLDALSSGLTVYENTPVKDVEEDIVYTENYKVRAKNIVFATHFPFINFPGYYFARMHQERSYVLALKNVEPPNGMYISADKEGLSFRRYKEYLLLGGAGHRTGENSQGGKYDYLRRAAERYFPGCSEVAHWSAQDCITLDSVPYIGRFAKSTPNWYVATGYMKWGMTSSMVAADIISDMICETENPYAGIFSPHRFNASSIPSAIKDTAQAVKGISRENLALPHAYIDELQKGHGGIVEADGEKIGVYKDAKGAVYAVSTKCPHLGCQLEWNPDEKSWDCPCHGSRFDYFGKVIDNPAQKGVSLEKIF